GACSGSLQTGQAACDGCGEPTRPCRGISAASCRLRGRQWWPEAGRSAGSARQQGVEAPGQTARDRCSFQPGRASAGAGSAAGGKVLIAGGSVGQTASDRVLVFDPATRKVRQLGRLPSGLTHAAAAPLGGKALVFGGRGASLGTPRSSVLAIDPVSGRVRRAG